MVTSPFAQQGRTNRAHTTHIISLEVMVFVRQIYCILTGGYFQEFFSFTGFHSDIKSPCVKVLLIIMYDQVELNFMHGGRPCSLAYQEHCRR